MTFIADLAERLDKFVARMLPQHSRTKLAKLIGDGAVRVNGRSEKPSFALTPGDTVEVTVTPEETPAHDLTPFQMELDVVYEDDFVIVVNKPRGLATHPASSLKEPSLVNALLGRIELSAGSEPFRPGIVHRLDKDTTGLILVAKSDLAHLRLSQQIASRTAERRYLAVVQGDLEQPAFKIEAPIARDRANRLRMSVDPHGKPALTHVRRLERLREGTLVAARLETGRTHQIRVHLRAVGHPVLGDALYNPQRSSWPLQLHAAYLAFDHPMTGERVRLFQLPPEDFLGTGVVGEGSVEF